MDRLDFEVCLMLLGNRIAPSHFLFWVAENLSTIVVDKLAGGKIFYLVEIRRQNSPIGEKSLPLQVPRMVQKCR